MERKKDEKGKKKDEREPSQKEKKENIDHNYTKKWKINNVALDGKREKSGALFKLQEGNKYLLIN
jgi:hypothetical protein